MKEHNGGGSFCDLGVHFIDALLWMCGNPRVQAVSGMETDVIAKKKEDVMISIKESGAYIGTFTPRPYDPDEFSVEECAAGSMRCIPTSSTARYASMVSFTCCFASAMFTIL